MQKVCGSDIQVVDSVEGVVNRALDVFSKIQKTNDGNELNTNYGAKLFVTGFNDKKDKKEYDEICSRYKLEFGGIL